MIYEVFENGKCINTIVADPDFVEFYEAETGYHLEAVPERPPAPTSPLPTEEADAAALLVDHEYRLTLLELGLAGGGE